MSYVLIVRMKAQEGNEDRAAQLMAELARATREEAGCEAYVPCRENEDTRSFAIFECYNDQAAFEEHGRTEHFQRIAVGELWPLLESRERVFFETV